MGRNICSEAKQNSHKQCDTNEKFGKSCLQNGTKYSKVDVNEEMQDKGLTSRFSGCSQSISQGIQHVFYFYGRTVATYPGMFIFLCFVLTGICSIGLLKLQSENRPFKLFVPHDSDFVRIGEWQEKNFPDNYRYHGVIYEADNVLEKQVLLELLRVHEAVAGTVAKVTSADGTTESQRDAASNTTSTGSDSYSSSDSVVREVHWQDVCTKLPSLAHISFFGRRKRRSQDEVAGNSHHSGKIITEMNNKHHVDLKNLYNIFYENQIQNSMAFDHVDNLKDDLIVHRSKRHVEQDWSSYLTQGSYCSLLDQIGKECLEKSLLEIWGYDRGLLESLSQEDIIEAVNSRDTSAIFGVQTNFTNYLREVTRDETGRIVAAKAMLQTWLSVINPDRIIKGKYIDEFITGVEVDVDGYKWEGEFIKTLLNDTERPEGVNVYAVAASSFSKISDENIYGDLGLMGFGYSLVFVYIQVMLGKFNLVETRPLLSLLGILAVLMSMVISYGLSSALGFKVSVMTHILPFLLLGLGIDDMFVIMQAWNNLTPEERRETLPVRVGCAMKHAGASIALTSATDFVAFAIGSRTVLPGLLSFCIFAAIGIVAVFFLQATFFVACFTFDQRRIESKRSGLICCWKMPSDYKPNECSQRDICQTLFSDMYAKFLLKPAVKVCVLLCTVTLFCVSCWGVTNLRQEFNPMWFLPKDSYMSKFISKYVQYFPTSGDPGTIYFGNVILFQELPNIEKFVNALESSKYIGRVDSWYKAYKRYFESQGFAVPDPLATETEFQDDLSLFLFSLSGFKYREKNFKFASPPSCFDPAPTVVASSIDFNYNRFSSSQEKFAAMHFVKNLAKTCNISGFVAAASTTHAGVETDEIIEKELYKNLSLALLVIFLITFALIASVVQSLFVLSCVVMTLVDVGAMMHWWGLTIDTVACLCLVVAVGLCVDYAAHVGHTFMTVQGSRNTRARLTLARIGPAVLNGGFSTFLAFVFLANSNAHVFITFFKIFFGVCLYGLFHGLVYLPVLLSLVGPAPYPQLDVKSTKSNWECDTALVAPAAADGVSDGGDTSAGGGVSDTRVDDCEMGAVTTAVSGDTVADVVELNGLLGKACGVEMHRW